MHRLRTLCFESQRILANERGIVLAASLLVIVVLVSMGLSTTFSGFTNLTVAVNHKKAANASSSAKAGVNEALYRLSRQIGQPGAITIDMDKAFWNDPDREIQIAFTTGDTDISDGTVSTLQAASDWPSGQALDPIVIRYKKPNPGNPSQVLFYDRTIDPPFRTYTLPAAVGVIVDTAHPIVQILSTGLDDRGAERQVSAEAAYSVAFPPPAALSSGVDLNMGGSGFIDSTNHSPFIRFSDAAGNADVYGDGNNNHTTWSFGGALEDSPDDSVMNQDAAIQYLPDVYDIDPRIFNLKINATADPATDAAFVGLSWNAGTLRWNGTNPNAVSPVALGNAGVILGLSAVGGGAVLSKGVFTWGANSDDSEPDIDYDPDPPSGTLCTGITPPLICRPGSLNPFPDFQEFLGLDDVAFQKLLDSADTTLTDLNNGNPPLGFTYIDNPGTTYTFNNSDDMPPDGEYGLMYVRGNLRFNGNARYKGVIFIDGDLDSSGTNYFLGAIMVQGITQTDTLGTFNLLYSKKAAEWGLQAGNPWRVIGWADTELQN